MSFLPSPRLASALALTSLGFLVGAVLPEAVWVAIAADGALLAGALVDFVLAPRRGDLELQLVHPGRASLGRRLGFEARLKNRGRRPCTVVAFRDDLHPELGVVTRAGPVRVAPAGTHVFEYSVVAARRGRLDLGAVVLRVSGPWGLAWRQIRFRSERRLTVVPGIEYIRRYELLALVGRLREIGLRPTPLRGEGTSFASLREYAPGDDLRRIDWKATARRGRWISREYESERSQTVFIVLDAGRLMTAELEGRARFEYALPAALLLTHVAGLNGDRVGLLVFSDRVHTFLPPSRGSGAERAVAEALATAEPSLVEPDYPGAFRYLTLRARKRSLIVVFTDVIDELASQALVRQMLALPRRHLVLVVALTNPDLHRWTEAHPNSPAAAFRKAAAEEMLSARAHALAQMRRAGVTVADILPTEATPETVNRYLEFKRRLRI